MTNSTNEWAELEAPDYEVRTDTHRLALESIFRWTLRRDELSDTEIVRAIKRVTTAALDDF